MTVLCSLGSCYGRPVRLKRRGLQSSTFPRSTIHQKRGKSCEAVCRTVVYQAGLVDTWPLDERTHACRYSGRSFCPFFFSCKQKKYRESSRVESVSRFNAVLKRKRKKTFKFRNYITPSYGQISKAAGS